jgi:ribosome maturation factor RimP
MSGARLIFPSRGEPSMGQSGLERGSNAMVADPQHALDEPRLLEETGTAARIAQVVQPVLAGLGYQLVRVKLSAQAGMTVQIMAERPDGSMTVNDCEIVSGALSPALDIEDFVKGAYHLEISSPGIDRPLVRVSDFRRACGREARIEMTTGVGGRRRFRGRIAAIEGEGPGGTLTLDLNDAKPGEATTVVLSLSDVAEAKLVLSEELIRQSLRAAKASQGETGTQSEDSGIAGPGEDVSAGPRRKGAGSARGAVKAKPVLPAGVQPKLKQGKVRHGKLPARRTKAGLPETGDRDGRKRQ